MGARTERSATLVPMALHRHVLASCAAFLALALVAAACGGDGAVESSASESPPSTEAAAPAETSAPPTEPMPTTVPTAEPVPTTEPATTIEWVQHETDDDCVCADGSEFVYFTRTNPASDKVMLYFQGGGACFTEQMCSFGEDGTYTVTADADDNPTDAGGIFDFDNPANPIADYSVVFVPYCTGDVHLGDATTDYSDTLTVEHNGFPNAMHGLDEVVTNFGDASEVFVTGSSAGGVPAPLFAGLVADAMPDARVAALADASGGYPSNGATNEVIGNLWGTGNNVPDWSSTAGVTAVEFGIPDLFHLAGNHNPDIRFARYDNAWDDVQVSFSAFANVGEEGLPAVLAQNEELVEGKGVNLPVYIAPGTDHTILLRPEMYELVVEGTPFVDWLTAFERGDDPGDVRCVDCERPA